MFYLPKTLAKNAGQMVIRPQKMELRSVSFESENSETTVVALGIGTDKKSPEGEAAEHSKY